MTLPNLHNTALPVSAPFIVGPSDGVDDTIADDGFVDRRRSTNGVPARSERRQFGSSHYGLTDDGRELALAIDQYKVEHHRRYLTCDEMLAVIVSLGYTKQT